MKTYPYQTPEGVIELVEKREYDTELSKLYDLLRVANQTSATMDLKAIKLERANAELIERLTEARESHLHASARGVRTIQRQSVLLERLAKTLQELGQSTLSNKGYPMCPECSCIPSYEEEHLDDCKIGMALSAYESANLEPAANPIDEVVQRMEAIPIHDLKTTYRKGSEILGLQCDGVQAVRACLIQAAKGES